MAWLRNGCCPGATLWNRSQAGVSTRSIAVARRRGWISSIGWHGCHDPVTVRFEEGREYDL